MGSNLYNVRECDPRLIPIKALEMIAFSNTIQSQIMQWLYECIAPRLYLFGDFEILEFDHSPHPFKIVNVDPNKIKYVTGREFWFWGIEKFGMVKSGDWDIVPKETDRNADGDALTEMYVRSKFNETPIYQSLELHFKDGVPWERTPYFELAATRINDENCRFKGIETMGELRELCNNIDGLYETIKREGYKSQKELADAKDTDYRPLPSRAYSEVLVDIGRDGELLLTGGFHRLAIAKLLNLNNITVSFLVRHPKWMKFREKIVEKKISFSHPDLRDIN